MNESGDGESRPTMEWSIEPGVRTVVVYVDEVARLEADKMLYGNVFVGEDEHGVCVRIDPTMVKP